MDAENWLVRPTRRSSDWKRSVNRPTGAHASPWFKMPIVLVALGGHLEA